MAHEKLEPRLATFIEHQKIRAAAIGLTAAAVEEQPIEVTISHAEDFRADEGRERTKEIQALGEKVKQSQSPILDRLSKVGVSEYTTHTLTNAVTAKLTPKQLAVITKLEEVKLVRLELLEPVTCMNESVRVIEATEAQQDFGVNGRGIKVAILDSGIDKNHPALSEIGRASCRERV